MSRSYKKHPVCSISVSTSEKNDKKGWHANFRSKSRQYLKNKIIFNDDWDFPIHFRIISNPYCFSKDGKQWIRPLSWKRGNDMFASETREHGGRNFLYTQKYLYQLLGK